VALKAELPGALRRSQQGTIAPVDLAKAAIGPVMQVFSRDGKAIEADGTDMTVRTALALIVPRQVAGRFSGSGKLGILGSA
jgi:putative DNA methylase